VIVGDTLADLEDTEKDPAIKPGLFLGGAVMWVPGVAAGDDDDDDAEPPRAVTGTCEYRSRRGFSA